MIKSVLGNAGRPVYLTHRERGDTIMAEKRGAGGKNQEYSENNGEYLSSCEQTPVESVDKGQTARKPFRRRTPLESVRGLKMKIF